jgi:hypothetical protein
MNSYLAGCILTALLIALGHWFPWPQGALNRIAAYTYGLAAIIVGCAVWMPEDVLFRFIGVCAVAGFVTGLGYLYDMAANGHWSQK